MVLTASGVMTVALRGPAASAGPGQVAFWYCNTTTSVGQPCIPLPTTTEATTTGATTASSVPSIIVVPAAAPTTTAAPATTAAPSTNAAPTTTGAPSTSTAPTTVLQPAVLGAQPTMVGVSAPEALPTTGSSTQPLTALGGVLILLGAGAMAASRIRRA
jgi:LPXTG-motif cell wall-anchored protein